jgi:formate/nitrite transporter FocA (FNT family)
MNYPSYSKLRDQPYQTFVDNHEEVKNTEDFKNTTMDDSAIDVNEGKLSAAKGIICGLMICIPFWYFFIKFIIWLIQD